MHVNVFTDHKSLQYMFTQKELNLRLSMGSTAHVEEGKEELAKEVHRLARLGVQLIDSGEGGTIVRNGAESSLVAKCLRDHSLVVLTEKIRVKESLTYVEIPVHILDRQVCQLRTKEVASVKVLLQNQLVEEATWEGEEVMKSRYPHPFVPPNDDADGCSWKFFVVNNSSPFTSYRALNIVTSPQPDLADTSLSNEVPQQAKPPTKSSNPCLAFVRQAGRVSTQYWKVEAIDSNNATKHINIKASEVNNLPSEERIIVCFDNCGAAYGEAQGLLASYCGLLAIDGNLFPFNFDRLSGLSGLPKKYMEDCFETLLKVLHTYFYCYQIRKQKIPHTSGSKANLRRRHELVFIVFFF
ncbi:uncharacterized protein LOC129892804 [Solanum dulcamara]|uniref:uncharacterized protein LOC129892804 n=1 Tax=Solanum dulcamara TaxID=45834 RepID=UPI0024861E61|nr:uncharacterized protein LOC129892804 [Solanum dulcamara]